ncbi:utrophin-like [Choristoneura fumiferana]|uniref:utrophin-like n=1 Tax=Choristoneura fumiferana TaxID=7141 RepID=UPI003D157EF2
MFTLLKGWEVLAGSLLREGGDDDEREDVQKKTFAKWINSQLVKNGKPLVSDLFSDLRDGEVLLSLLEILTAQQYKRERGRMRVHHVNNVSTALRALAAAGVRLVNISSSDVVDGNPKLILGLVWSIILHWQVQYHLKDLMTELQQTSLERTLLAWCRAHTQGYAGVDVVNFTWSWADGLALNALLHRWRPALFAWEALAARAPRDRLDHAFALAHDYLGIDRLLDPEDVDTPNPDKKSIMMYLMCLFQSLPHAADASRRRARRGGPRRTSGSLPLSAATTGSGELGAYGAALEDALAWLLDAEERLAARAPPPPAAPCRPQGTLPHARGECDIIYGRPLIRGVVCCVTQSFLLELAGQQARVGAVLALRAAGGRGRGRGRGGGAGEGALSAAEAREVRLQRRLLAARWETLRRRGMERQAAVHAALMRAQRETRDDFR